MNATPFAALLSAFFTLVARESVQRFVDVGVDELILVMQTATTPHEVIMESIRTFAEEVMPCFA